MSESRPPPQLHAKFPLSVMPRRLASYQGFHHVSLCGDEFHPTNHLLECLPHASACPRSHPASTAWSCAKSSASVVPGFLVSPPAAAAGVQFTCANCEVSAQVVAQRRARQGSSPWSKAQPGLQYSGSHLHGGGRGQLFGVVAVNDDGEVVVTVAVDIDTNKTLLTSTAPHLGSQARALSQRWDLGVRSSYL